MFTDRDTGDIKGLEDVFRSQGFRRVGNSVGDVLRTDPARPGEDERGPQVGGSDREPEDAPVNESDVSGPRLQTSDGGAPSGGEQATMSSGTPWRRHSTRYWTIASVSALVALVAAGVTAGSGQHGRPSVAAEGQHGKAGPGSGFQTLGPATAGLAAPGGLLGAAAAAGAGDLSAGTGGGADRTHGSGAVSGGHVSLSGAATFTGAPGSTAVPSGSSATGGGAGAGAPPPASGGSNPIAPVVSTVGNMVSAVGASVTTAASQVGSSVPAVGSATGAVNTVVTALDQAVGAATS
jgi:hypothetical protein